jgi:hypothetical protein
LLLPALRLPPLLDVVPLLVVVAVLLHPAAERQLTRMPRACEMEKTKRCTSG